MFKHCFDVSKQASEGKKNSALTSAARFISMHARTGAAAEHLYLAIVVHGKAVDNVAQQTSTNASLVAALAGFGVKIIVCGQSAVYCDVALEDLLPDVEMLISAMTTHTLLQQDVYSLNPF